MKKRYIGVLFVTAFLTLFEGKVVAQEEKSLDIVTELVQGEEYLRAWRIEEASGVANKLLSAVPENPYVCFFAGEVYFYEGNYEESLAFLKKALKDPRIASGGREFYDFVDKVYQTTGKFKEAKTEHFIFRYNEEKDAILADYALDALEKAYTVIGNDLNYFPEKLVLVEVFPDAESFCTISTLTKEEIETSGTVAICLFNRVIITSPRLQSRGYQWLDTLTHEYVHYVIMKKTYNRVPVWLHEGIAKYEEKRWIDHVPPGLPVSLESLLAEAVAKDYFITFDQMHPSLAKLEKKEDTALAFAEVFTVIDYLLKRGGYPLLAIILEDIKNGNTTEGAIQLATGVPFDEFAKDWLQDLKQKKLRRIHGIRILPTRLKESSALVDDVESVAEIEVRDARKYAIIGDLLRREGLQSAAVIEYEKAFEKANNISPQIQNKLAKAYIMDTQYSKAEDILKVALEYYPEYTTTYILLGELYQRKGEYQEAIEILSKANAINPFNPLIHKNLVTLYSKLNRDEDVAIEQKRLMLLVK
ncbi:MAG: tetratricopeptide repeat protein [Candidatus Loosdrechtia sp.]|uniref:tetratricopeptide repeat protein n=1 Tax=Candidatus Loosdrechtia sp. TaxID=3101272 RepID=UPI003A73B0D5|nr:MAG: peptidase MA family metallohydrolase [Candidatus Jettenia sp. AMX2]